MFQCGVKGTGYPLHSPVSPSLPDPCVTVCHHVSTTWYFVQVNLRNARGTQNKPPQSVSYNYIFFGNATCFGLNNPSAG